MEGRLTPAAGGGKMKHGQKGSKMEQQKSKYDYSLAAPPRVTASVGYTVNVGNFESLRIDLGVEDVKRPGETLKEANARLFNFVNDELEDKVMAAKRTFNG